MPLITFRDPNGQPIPYIWHWVGVNDQEPPPAVNYTLWGCCAESAGHADVKIPSVGILKLMGDPVVEKFVLFANTHNVLPKYGTARLEVPNLDQDWTVDLPWAGGGGGGGFDWTPGPGGLDLTSRPRRGSSLYGAFGDPAWDFPSFVRILHDTGLRATKWWCWGGWANWQGRMPFQRTAPDGPWDLFAWDESYFADAKRYVEFANSYGVRPTITIVDLYPWAQEKQGLPGIPDANKGPFRWNTNGVKWGMGSGSHPDDPFYLEQPGGGPETGPGWLAQFILRLVRAVKGLAVDFETGNEMSESGLHDRIKDLIQSEWPEAWVISSRNSDSPGQYQNMVETHGHSGIDFHGWKNMARLQQDWDEPAGRPQTYIELLDHTLYPHVEGKRITACSDGARNGNPDPDRTYDWADLLTAFEYATDRGCNVDHQSAAKMALFTYGRHDMPTAFEQEFFRKIARL